jgi:hypothetical protein
MVRAPGRLPVVAGLNLIEIIQFKPASNELPHVLVSAKSPLIETRLILRVAPPEFVSVTI